MTRAAQELGSFLPDSLAHLLVGHDLLQAYRRVPESVSEVRYLSYMIATRPQSTGSLESRCSQMIVPRQFGQHVADLSVDCGKAIRRMGSGLCPPLDNTLTSRAGQSTTGSSSRRDADRRNRPTQPERIGVIDTPLSRSAPPRDRAPRVS